MKCVCPMGGERMCPDDCPIAVWANLSPADRAAQRKSIAEKLYKAGLTMAQIATQLGVSIQTISTDLVNFQATGKSKPAKTATNPKGAGRPKGSGARRKNTSPIAQAAAKSILDEGKTYNKAERESGLSNTVLRAAVNREEGRREVDPIVTPDMLSMTAQQKFDTAIRQHKAQLAATFHAEVHAGVQKFMEDTILPMYNKKYSEWKQVVDIRKGVMDKATFNKIRRCLHPDSRASVTDAMLHDAFHTLMGLQIKLLNEKDHPTSAFDWPKTYADAEALKAKVRAERKAKRGNGAALRPRM